MDEQPVQAELAEPQSETAKGGNEPGNAEHSAREPRNVESSVSAKPEPESPANGHMQKPPGESPSDVPRRRSLPRGLTGNAIVSGIVSAIVAGVISFLIAHQQTQDAARQALTGQQMTATVQLEAAATAFYQDAMTRYNWNLCGVQRHAPVTCPYTPPTASSFDTDLDTFLADAENVSDQKVSTYAGRLLDDVNNSLSAVGPKEGDSYITRMGLTYISLIKRCSQLIQGQQ